MEGTYDLILGHEKRGTVNVTGEGLYWKITAQCDLYSDVMQDLIANAGDRQIKLGLLAPEGGRYCLRTRIAKREMTAIESFGIRSRHRVMDDFYPINPEEPFAYLHRLQEAHLARQGNQLGLVFGEKNNGKKSKIMLDK